MLQTESVRHSKKSLSQSKRKRISSQKQFEAKGDNLFDSIQSSKIHPRTQNGCKSGWVSETQKKVEEEIKNISIIS